MTLLRSSMSSRYDIQYVHALQSLACQVSACQQQQEGELHSGLLLLGCCCIYGAELNGPSCRRLEHGWRRQHCVKAL